MTSLLDEALAWNRAIDIAQAKIARALEELEKRTNAEVQSIALRDFDVTQPQDDAPRFARGVSVTLRRRPASEWATYPNLKIED